MSCFRTELITEIIIDAPGDLVYELIIDVENYDKWNPFVVRSVRDKKVKNDSGIRVGEILTNTHKFGESEKIFTPVV